MLRKTCLETPEHEHRPSYLASDQFLRLHVKNFNWRRRFIELCEDIFRELGFPPPIMTHEDSLPLAMELEVEGMQFELLHSSSQMAERVLVICKLGPLPDEGITAGIRRLMQANLAQVRKHELGYGINPSGNEVQCLYYAPIDGATAREMLDGMRKTVSACANWKDQFFTPPLSASNAEVFRPLHGLA